MYPQLREIFPSGGATGASSFHASALSVAPKATSAAALAPAEYTFTGSAPPLESNFLAAPPAPSFVAPSEPSILLTVVTPHQSIHSANAALPADTPPPRPTLSTSAALPAAAPPPQPTRSATMAPPNYYPFATIGQRTLPDVTDTQSGLPNFLQSQYVRLTSPQTKRPFAIMSEFDSASDSSPLSYHSYFENSVTVPSSGKRGRIVRGGAASKASRRAKSRGACSAPSRINIVTVD